MTDNSDEAWLIGLANDVCDGKPVDWERVVPPGAAAESQQMVAELRRLATVVDAHRTLGEEAPAPAPSPEPITTSGVWGPLVLLETVGHGAFGTVYRAWDAQLDREVALKVLLQVPLESPLEEARHLARIRHPNVVSVYGAERVDEQVGIWMEFIEGETLGTVVGERGPMSAREVAGIGIDLCRALSALHRSDLVHGDIKAQNVMREVGGRIVLMDFSGVRAPDAHAAPEFSGTPPYIAPELFEGRGASFGADIYSLGVLLFYLLSGHFPVDGEDVAEIRRRHASGERVRLRDIRPELPDAVVEIVERATAVDRGERFRTAGDLEHALMGIFAGHGATSGAGSAQAGARASRAGWVLAAAAAIALAGSIAAWRYVPRERVQAGPLVRLWVGPPYNTGPWPRVAPDGSSIVFGTTVDGRKVLWLHPLGSGQGHAIKAAETTETAFWSADSRRIGFFSDGKLKTVDVATEHVETIADAGTPHGGSWNANGVLLYGVKEGIARVAADGSGRALVTSLDQVPGDYQHGWPEFLPDGNHFLYVVRSRVEERTGVYYGSLESPSLRKWIMPAYSRVAYSPTGHLLFVRNGALLAQSFDPQGAVLSGEPITLSTAVKAHSASDGAFDVSRTSILIFRGNEILPSTKLVLFDRRGRQLREITANGLLRYPRFSPDGNRIAAEQAQTDAPNADLWVFDAAVGRASQFTSAPAPDVRPAWSPDGKRVAFSSKRGTAYDIYVKGVDVLEDEKVLWHTDADKMVEDWSPDGRTLSVTVLRSGLWTYPVDTTKKPTFIRAGSGDSFQSEFAPNGRWLAYARASSGHSEVYVEPVPATGEVFQVSTNGGTEPHWRRDTGELFYLTLDHWMAAVAVPASGTWDRTLPNRLFRVPIPETLSGRCTRSRERENSL